jgi:UDP-3-O-[3-hydroxymyristoyl] glucosamine N-acyltransferase
VVNRRFFDAKGSLSLQKVSEITGALLTRGDPGEVIEAVAPLEHAGPGELASCHNASYVAALRTTKASAVLVTPEHAKDAPHGAALFEMRDPKKGLSLLLEKLYGGVKPMVGIHKTAVISSSARLGHDCSVGPGVVIEDGAEIGNHCVIGANSVIGRSVVIGHRCTIESHVSISYACIGDDVSIKPGARIGQRGFGFFMGDGNERIAQLQLGAVVIGDRVDIGANVTIDRGSLRNTVIESDVHIDNLVQIAHNVFIGQGSVILSQTGISGSTSVGKGVILGGQVGVAGHLSIGEGARILSKSGVIGHVAPGAILAGYPAVPRRLFFKSIAVLMGLTKRGTQNILKKNNSGTEN